MLVGLARSLMIALGAFILGVGIGTVGALGKLSGSPVARQALDFYTTLGRSVPELVLILIIYFAGSDLLNAVLTTFGFVRVDFNGAFAGIVVLGVVQGAYSTEVIRGAILAVPKGQIEAAHAYGMSSFLTLRRVTLPAMLPAALPGLSNLWLIAMKDTALLAVLGFGELTQVTRQAAGATKAYFTFFLAAGCMYLLATLLSNAISRTLEKRATKGVAHV